MENEVLTSTEPTIVESSAENTAVPAENTTVIDNATPMDSNITYNSLPKTEYQPNMSPTQNIINEAVQTEHVINQEDNAGKAMNNFLNNSYDYDKNEAGSYWVAGAINDNNTQMSFLQTLINEDMYDEMDLQKYYYDTNMATARAYAAQKGKETAYGFYRAAQERALAEGELTGWYMPAEGRYLLGQYTVAQNTLENPDATPEEISKANRVAKVAESWFSANQITTRGIKCLAMMNYEENVRHNTVMGELQKQANAIAAQGAAASAAGTELQLRELKFQVEEMELQTGYDFSNAIGLDNRNYIGHNPEDYKDLQALKGYDTTKQMLENDVSAYSAVLGATNTEWIDNILGDKARDTYNNYEGKVGDERLKQSLKDNDNKILHEDYLNKQNYEIKSTEKLKDIGSDRHVYTFTHTENGKGVTKAYYKDDKGVFHQIKKDDIELKTGGTIGDKIYNFSKSTLSENGFDIQIGSKKSYAEMEGSISKNKDSYPNLSKEQIKTIEDKEKEGYKIKVGYKSTQGIDADIVMENDKGELIEVSNTFGKAKEISEKQIKENKFKDKLTSDSSEVSSLRKIGTMPEYKSGSIKEKNANIYIAKDAKGEDHYYVYAGYVALGIGSGYNKYEKIDSKTASKYVDDLDSISQAMNDYSDGIIKTKGGKNSSTIIKENEGSKKVDTSIDLKTSGAGGSGGSGKNASKTDYNPDTIKAKYTKYDIETDGSPVLATLNEKEREELQKNKINKVVI